MTQKEEAQKVLKTLVAIADPHLGAIKGCFTVPVEVTLLISHPDGVGCVILSTEEYMDEQHVIKLMNENITNPEAMVGI